jgi:hypothetical protein
MAVTSGALRSGAGRGRSRWGRGTAVRMVMAARSRGAASQSGGEGLGADEGDVAGEDEEVLGEGLRRRVRRRP